MKNKTLLTEKQRAVELHIEELVLHGFEASDRNEIANSVQQHLAYLFETEGVPPSAGKTEQGAAVDAGEFTVKSGTSKTTLGEQVADSVYRGIARRNA